MWLLTGLLGVHYLMATVVAFIVINPVGYALNRRFTFGPGSVPWLRQLMRYYGVMFTSLVANLVLVALLVDGLGVHYLLATLVSMVVMTIFNFASHAFWTYRAKKSPESGGDLDV